MRNTTTAAREWVAFCTADAQRVRTVCPGVGHLRRVARASADVSTVLTRPMRAREETAETSPTAYRNFRGVALAVER
jgi:hypothetical protein